MLKNVSFLPSHMYPLSLITTSPVQGTRPPCTVGQSSSPVLHPALLSFPGSLDSQLFCQNYIYSETNCHHGNYLINWYIFSSHFPEMFALRILMLEFQCIEERGISNLNTATFDKEISFLDDARERSIWNGFSFQHRLCMWVVGPSMWLMGVLWSVSVSSWQNSPLQQGKAWRWASCLLSPVSHPKFLEVGGA